VRIRSGDVVRIRQVRPDDALALAHAYANLGEQSRYRRFFTAMPELPDHTLKAAVEVDHDNHEALVATPLLSVEILGECSPVVSARVHITEPPQPPSPDLLDLLLAAARGEVVSLPVLFRRLIRVPDEVTHTVRLPVAALLTALRSRFPAV
jgi:hypothetical protein